MTANVPTQGDGQENWLESKNVSVLNPDDELHLVCLEERVLYSAVPLPIDLVEYVDAENTMAQDADLAFENVDQGLDLIQNGVERYFDDSQSDQMDLLASDLQVQDVGTENYEIVFVDQSVDGYQQLVDDILNRSNGDVQYDVAFINSSSNGLQQISSILASQANTAKSYHAVHLVTHGSDATVNFGNTQVDSSNIHNFASEFIGWQNALATDADILIYGCEVAETELGEQFVQEISDLTGADVAASDDLTGHQELGGDWEFEFVVGVVETESAFSSTIESSWMHTLAGEQTTGESGTATGRSLAVNDSQTVVQVFAHDQGLGDGLDIFYQISDENGTQAAVQVNTAYPSDDQHWATVAIDNDGDFVVVWTDELSTGGQGVFAKYFASDGSVIREDFRVDAIGSNGNDASVAIDASGNFIVVWEGSGAQDSDGIYAQRYDVTGAEVGSTFLVNDVASAGLTQGNADVAMNDSGQFVIAWDDFNSIYSESNIYARWYDSDGTPAGSNETLVDSDPTRIYMDPSVAINNNGNFVVAYTLDTEQNVKEGSLVWCRCFDCQQHTIRCQRTNLQCEWNNRYSRTRDPC